MGISEYCKVRFVRFFLTAMMGLICRKVAVIGPEGRQARGSLIASCSWSPIKPYYFHKLTKLTRSPEKNDLVAHENYGSPKMPYIHTFYFFHFPVITS